MISPRKNKPQSVVSDFSKIHMRNLKKKLVTIHFRPSHPQTKMFDTSFCALVGLFLTNTMFPSIQIRSFALQNDTDYEYDNYVRSHFNSLGNLQLFL